MGEKGLVSKAVEAAESFVPFWMRPTTYKKLGKVVLVTAIVGGSAGYAAEAGWEALVNHKYLSVGETNDTKTLDNGKATISTVDTDMTKFSTPVAKMDGTVTGVKSQATEAYAINFFGASASNILPKIRNYNSDEKEQGTIGINAANAQLTYTDPDAQHKNGELTIDLTHAAFTTDIENKKTTTDETDGNALTIGGNIGAAFENAHLALGLTGETDKLNKIHDELAAENRTAAKQNFNECMKQIPSDLSGFVAQIEDNARYVASQAILSSNSTDKAFNNLNRTQLQYIAKHAKVILPGGSAVDAEGSSTSLAIPDDPTIATEQAAEKKNDNHTTNGKFECDASNAVLISAQKTATATATPTPAPTAAAEGKDNG